MYKVLKKLLNAMHGEKFSAILIADAVSADQVFEIKQGYENMYSTLSKFQKVEYTAGKNESRALAEGISEGVTDSINDSIGLTQSYAKSQTDGTNNSSTKGSSTGASIAPFGIGVNKGGNKKSKTFGINHSKTFYRYKRYDEDNRALQKQRRKMLQIVLQRQRENLAKPCKFIWKIKELLSY